MRTHPDTSGAAAVLDGWKPANADRAARALANHARDAEPGALALEALAWDPPAQERHLRELAQEPRLQALASFALQAWPGLKNSQAREEMWKAVAGAAAGKSPEDLVAQLRTSGNLTQADRQALEALVNVARAEQEVRQLVDGSRQTGGGIAESGDRVVVGSVVVRKPVKS